MTHKPSVFAVGLRQGVRVREAIGYRSGRGIGPAPGRAPAESPAVLDEAVIRRVVGGPQVMRDQLTHLLNLAEQPNITLQVVPYEAGAFGTMSGSTAVLEFHDAEDSPVAYVEYVRGGAWVENRDDVNMLATTFDLASEVALTPADTADLIRRQIEGLTK